MAKSAGMAKAMLRTRLIDSTQPYIRPWARRYLLRYVQARWRMPWWRPTLKNQGLGLSMPRGNAT